MSNISRHQEGTLGKEVRDSVETAKNSVQEMGPKIRDAAKEGLENLKSTAADYVEHGRDYLERGKDRAMELEHSLEEQIANRPLSAVLIAAGIGFAIGLMCTRR